MTAPGTVRLVHSLAEMEQLLVVFSRVWGFPPGVGLVSPDFMKALAHAGGYVSAAFEGDEMVGGSMAFRGVHDGQPSLHSHVTGVVPGREHAGLGRALKRHQRLWAIDAGIPVITWTFDPLVRRNAWFNLQRLGVQCSEYLVDFYGPLRDGINGDDETDRIMAVWDVAGERAVLAADGALEAPHSDGLRAAGAHHLLAVGDDGTPVETPEPPGAGRTLLVSVPADIVAIRRADAERAGHERDATGSASGAADDGRALAWRHAVRATLGDALQRGYVVTDMTADGAYVLRWR